MLQLLKNDLQKFADSKKAETYKRFFKTGVGEYGEKIFLIGVSAPNLKTLVKKYVNISFTDISNLLKSKIHEERLVALLILVFNFQKKLDKQDKIFSFYLKNRKYIDNWDLVDLSAYKIVGKYLFEKDKSLLYEMANSKNLWERRIAIVSTFHFIRNQKFDDTFNIAKILLNDKQDLIHKAVGWMLREVGKQNEKLLEKFLKGNYKQMPRTTLRYAIEKFSEKKRKSYLNKNYKIINKN